MRYGFYDGKGITVTAVGKQAHEVTEEARLKRVRGNGSADQHTLVFEDKDVPCPTDFVRVVKA